MNTTARPDVHFKTIDHVDVRPAGVFTARIATFNKADKIGDIVRPGAFAKSIARLQAAGEPLPVVFSHQSTDPAMYIGECAPDDIKERARELEVTGRLDCDSAS
jgi:hypothetical protein